MNFVTKIIFGPRFTNINHKHYYGIMLILNIIYIYNILTSVTINILSNLFIGEISNN